MSIYLGLLLVGALLGGIPDDEEEKRRKRIREKGGEVYIKRTEYLLRRAMLDISFWWSPNSAMELLQSPAAVTSSITAMTDIINGFKALLPWPLDSQTPRYIQGKNKGEYRFSVQLKKNIPIVRQFLRWATPEDQIKGLDRR
jgi:hypothetical protein